MKSCTWSWIALVGIASALLPGTCVAGQYGNDTAATARPIMADGMTYTDELAPTNANAWFVFRIDPNQSYSIEVWSPFGPQLTLGNLCVVKGVFEADGTTIISTTFREFELPAPQVDAGVAQGARRTFIASGSARPVTFHVGENFGPPPAAHLCAIRVAATTLASARWSVNGYSDFIAVSNVSSPGSAINGSILYFNDAGTLVGSDPLTLAADASVQIVKANGVAIGGALKGGIRIVHDGAPGTIVAHQLWYNPVTNAYIQYPFAPLVHSYARGGI